MEHELHQLRLDHDELVRRFVAQRGELDAIGTVLGALLGTVRVPKLWVDNLSGTLDIQHEAILESTAKSAPDHGRAFRTAADLFVGQLRISQVVPGEAPPSRAR
jgi:hypothetical protein